MDPGEDEAASAQLDDRAARFPRLTEEQRREVHEAFATIEAGGGGRIDRRELRTAMRALGHEPQMEDLKRYLSIANENADNSVDLRGFEAIVRYKLGEVGSQEEVLKAFRMLDYDATGRISLENLRQANRELSMGIEDYELQEMVSEADFDGDGEVNEGDFLSMLRDAHSRRL